MNNKNIIVTSCGECPFYEYQDEMQTSSCHLDWNIGFTYREQYPNGRWKAKYKNHDVNTIHPNCPMRSLNSVTVTIKTHQS